MSNLDDRISAALRARADQVGDADLNPALPPSGAMVAPPRRIRWIAPVIAAAAVAGIAIAATTIAEHRPEASHQLPAGVSSSVVPASTSAPPSVTSAPSTPGPSIINRSTSSDGSVELVCYFADASPCKTVDISDWFEPLWPYATYADAKRAVTIGCPTGCPAAAQTVALDFTRDYLGFTDITQVTSTQITGDQAKVGVGYLGPDGMPTTAAVLHLVRYERYPHSSAPWEVVGSEDTTLTIDTPVYGTRVGISIPLSGHITGVDENLTVTARSLTDSDAVTVGSIAAGGDDAPWSTGVDAPTTGTVTIVVSTGGHLQQHERFAIQGVTVT